MDKKQIKVEIQREREKMLQSIFPSERMRHAARIMELEKQLDE